MSVKVAGVLLAGCLILAVVAMVRSWDSSGNTLERSAAVELPQLVLWAWERAEDLTFLDPATTAVAFHAAHIRVQGGEVRVKRRRHPLLVPPGTRLVAVSHFSVARPSAAALPRVREAVIRLTEQPGVSGLQVDFEAAPSQRPFYRQLVRELRNALPSDYAFSTTALASWCLGDRWLDPAPFDEVVPMFFDMGKAGYDIREEFASGSDFVSAYCRTSVGVKVGDRIPAQFAGRRLYVFNSRPWTRGAYMVLTANRRLGSRS